METGSLPLRTLVSSSRQWKQQVLMRKGKPAKETGSVKFISPCNKAASLGMNLKWPLSLFGIKSPVREALQSKILTSTISQPVAEISDSPICAQYRLFSSNKKKL